MININLIVPAFYMISVLITVIITNLRLTVHQTKQYFGKPQNYCFVVFVFLITFVETKNIKKNRRKQTLNLHSVSNYETTWFIPCIFSNSGGRSLFALRRLPKATPYLQYPARPDD